MTSSLLETERKRRKEQVPNEPVGFEESPIVIDFEFQTFSIERDSPKRDEDEPKKSKKVSLKQEKP